MHQCECLCSREERRKGDGMCVGCCEENVRERLSLPLMKALSLIRENGIRECV